MGKMWWTEKIIFYLGEIDGDYGMGFKSLNSMNDRIHKYDYWWNKVLLMERLNEDTYFETTLL